MNRRNEKEEENPTNPTSAQKDARTTCHANEEVHLLLDNLAGFIFGSCISVVEAASVFVPNSWQNGANSNTSARKTKRQLDPRLARLAGRYQSKSINPQDSNEGIPSFLEGETLGYSVEEQTVFDDNISALSAYTLEEMAMMNAHTVVPVSRLGEKFSVHNSPPSVARTNSSSSSSHDHARYLFSSKKQALPRSKTPLGRNRR